MRQRVIGYVAVALTEEFGGLLVGMDEGSETNNDQADDSKTSHDPSI